jgi:hypothetical protein
VVAKFLSLRKFLEGNVRVMLNKIYANAKLELELEQRQNKISMNAATR